MRLAVWFEAPADQRDVVVLRHDCGVRIEPASIFRIQKLGRGVDLGGELRGGRNIGFAGGDASSVLGPAQLLRRFGMLGLD